MNLDNNRNKLTLLFKLENWITKYDQEMEEKKSELAALRQEYDRELKELKETEDAYPTSCYHCFG